MWLLCVGDSKASKAANTYTVNVCFPSVHKKVERGSGSCGREVRKGRQIVAAWSVVIEEQEERWERKYLSKELNGKIPAP